MKKTFRRILSALLVAVMLVCVAPVSGVAGLNFDWLDFSTKSSALEASGQCGDNVYYTFDESTGLLTISGEGEMYDYIDTFQDNEIIKTIVIENGVTSIGGWAFFGCVVLTSITIPDSVTSIGDYAFYGCTGLTNITIPDSVTSIGNYTLNGCTDLTSIMVDCNNEIYDSRENCNAIIETKTNTLIVGCEKTIIPNGIKSIGENAFSGCGGLTKITIPESVIRIEKFAFIGCVNLKCIVIPNNSITYIGVEAFSSCIKLANIKFPESLTNIDDFAFIGCSSLTNITISDNVINIGESVFSGCVNLCNIIVSENNKVYDSRENCNAIIETKTNILKVGCKRTNIPDSITNIGNSAFYYCKDLTTITFPDNIKSIENSAFCYCKNLTNIIIPYNVATIGEFAFFDCTCLKSITISDSVTSIGDNAFGYCNRLESVYYSGSESEWNEIDIGSDNECLTNATIHYNYNGSHTHTLKHIAVPSSCTVNGTEYDWCTGCGEKFNEKSLPLEEHSWGEWTLAKNPTATADGLECRICSNCMKMEFRDISKLQANVNSVSIGDITLNYKKSTTLKPTIKADEGAKYTVKYSSSNTKVATVDKNGKVTATKRGSGSATITCTVTDSNGNTVTDTCKVNVKLSFGQILITYILFGWIWY